MVGVPSSRACKACRAQRKRCIGTESPCVRCKRLSLPCEGFGEFKFKFVDSKRSSPPNIAGPSKQAANSSSDSSDTTDELVVDVHISHPSRPPCNSLTVLTSHVVGAIDPSVDIRFRMSWTFGDYLLEVPQHLGYNEALDAASDALVTAYPWYCGGNRGTNMTLLRKHTRTIGALRMVLNDPEKASSPETLCAINLIMIYQTLSKENARGLHHARGAAQILKRRGFAGGTTSFERGLLNALRGSIIVEACLDPCIDLTEREWNELIQGDSPQLGHMPEEIAVRCWSRCARLMKRVRAVKACASPIDSGALQPLALEALAIRSDLRPAVDTLGSRIHSIGAVSPRPVGPVHAYYTRLYGLSLGIALIANMLVGSLAADEDDALEHNTNRLGAELVLMAIESTAYRPLATLSIPMSLAIALVAVRKPTLRQEILKWYREYMQDLPNEEAHSGVWLDDAVNCFDLGLKEFIPCNRSSTAMAWP